MEHDRGDWSSFGKRRRPDRIAHWRHHHRGPAVATASSF